jgi:hypothetical protein
MTIVCPPGTSPMPVSDPRTSHLQPLLDRFHDGDPDDEPERTVDVVLDRSAAFPAVCRYTVWGGRPANGWGSKRQGESGGTCATMQPRPRCLGQPLRNRGDSRDRPTTPGTFRSRTGHVFLIFPVHFAVSCSLSLVGGRPVRDAPTSPTAVDTVNRALCRGGRRQRIRRLCPGWALPARRCRGNIDMDLCPNG